MDDSDTGGPPTLNILSSNNNNDSEGPVSPTFNKGVPYIKSPSTIQSRFQRRKTLKEKAGRKKPQTGNVGKEELARAFFTCKCMVCLDQVTKGHLFNVEKKVNMKLLVDSPTGFQQMVEWLFASSDKIKGAQILFPDTVFFEDGKPSFIARVDKEGCMFKITQPSKLGLQEIR